MKLTKYQHACLTLEKDGQLLVVDPGVFTTDLPPLKNVAAIVITHAHPDHFDETKIQEITMENPNAVVLVHSDIISLQNNTRSATPVQAGKTHQVGAFELAFFGGSHAIIHESIPPISNLGVMINNTLYYPGDSFTLPEIPVDTLAIPAAAPWLKISEAMDFLTAIKPRLAFPTHDAILSDAGKQIVDNLLSRTAQSHGIHYERIVEPIELV